LQKGYLKILQFQLYDQPDLFAKIKQQQFEVTEYILITVSETLFKWILFLHKQRCFWYYAFAFYVDSECL